MLKRTYFLTEEQVRFLESLPGNASENLRRAIDDYEQKIKKQPVTSASVRGGGIINGYH